MLGHTVELPKEHDHIYIIPISDVHIGDPRCDFDKLYSYLKWIKERPNAYIILNGDIMNTATKGSVSDVYEDTHNPKEQCNLAVKIFEPVKDRILTCVEGNHERRIAKDSSFSPTEVMAAKLGVHYSGDGALLYIRFGARPNNGKPQVYTVYATHGFGGGKKPGGKANNLESLSNILLADVYISSHTHFMTTFQKAYFVPDKRTKKVTAQKLTFVSTGAYLKWGGYVEQQGFPPSKLGSPRIRLEGSHLDVHVSI